MLMGSTYIADTLAHKSGLKYQPNCRCNEARDKFYFDVVISKTDRTHQTFDIASL